MITELLSIYRLTPTEDGRLKSFLSDSTTSFHPTLYSRFKYGDSKTAGMYASQIKECLGPRINKDESFFICGSAYNRVPTAAISIAKRMNQLFLDDGYFPTFFRVIGQAFADDYSSLEIEDREKILAQISLELEKGVGQRLRDKTVVVVDDIRVTGLHSQALERLFSRYGVRKVVFCYVAIVHQKAPLHANIEWHLNHHYVKSLRQLEKIMSTGHFEPNARICKFLLMARPKDIKYFISRAQPADIARLLHLIRLDGYDLIPRYKRMYNFICQAASDKKNAPLVDAVQEKFTSHCPVSQIRQYFKT